MNEVPDMSNVHFDGDRPASEGDEEHAKLTFHQRCFRGKRLFWITVVVTRLQCFLAGKRYLTYPEV